MVQYIVTPWRDHRELLDVRTHLYPNIGCGSDGLTLSTGSAAADDYHDDISRKRGEALEKQQRQRQRQRLAVGRVQMWAHRGGCPHLVESTALLVAVVLDDGEQSAAAAAAAVSDFAIRAAYATAFSRFVTGLLDSQQDKQKKQSMYSLAKTTGLPATFVELRHQATHEQLPSLLKLRSAAAKALVWIWDFYWRDLPAAPALSMFTRDVDSEVTGKGEGGRSGDSSIAHAPMAAMSCEAALLAFLRREIDEGAARSCLAPYDQWHVVKVADDIGNSTDDTKVMIRALHLVGELIEGTCSLITKEAQKPSVGDAGDGELPGRAGRGGGSSTLGKRQDRGWARLSKESWKPKPIGIV